MGRQERRRRKVFFEGFSEEGMEWEGGGERRRTEE